MIKFIETTAFKDLELDIEGKDIILISGMAGIGSIGKIAADAIKDHFKADLVCTIYFDDLPSQVLVEKAGKMVLPSVQVYYAKPTENKRFFIVTGEFQPASNNGMFIFVDELLNFLVEKKRLHLSLILSIGAYVTENPDDYPKVHVSGTGDRVINEFVALDKDIMRVMEEGIISGANGVIPAFGTILGIPGVCLLVETIPVVKRDPRAAKAVLEILSKYFEFPFDFSAIEKESKEIEKILNDIKKRSKSAGDLTDSDAAKDRQSYIG
nr:PAC2 family protein [Candidatus Sigynarchaeota archaeon]